MEIDLKLIADWLRANKLTLNVLKSEFMLIGSRQRIATLDTDPLQLFVAGSALRKADSVKCLGVHVDQYLTWGSHVNTVIKKVAANLSVLKKIKPMLNRDNLVKVYNTTIRPYFDYCCLVWDSIDQTLTDKLQKIQNRAARIITSAPYSEVRTRDVFKKLNWKTLRVSRLYSKAVMMFKIVNGLAPPYLIDLFDKDVASDHYALRNSFKNLKLPKIRGEHLKRSFAYSGAKLWNSLPRYLKEEENLDKFKQLLKHHDFALTA